MNYPGVVAADEGIIKKVEMAKKAGKLIDGHGPVIKNEELKANKGSRHAKGYKKSDVNYEIK